MARIPRLEALTRSRRVGLGAAVGLALALLLSLLRGTDLFEGLELDLVDLRTRYFAGVPNGPDPRIVLMQVEEEDVAWAQEHLGETWPWPLTTNAHLVRVLDEAGAAALMVDVLHLDRGAGPDDLPPGKTLDLPEQQRRTMEASGAADYGAAMKAFGKAALAFELTDTPEYELPLRRETALERLGADRVTATPALVRRGAELPVLAAGQGAAVLGFANTPPDLDGIVRRATVTGRWGERPVLSLPVATASLANGTTVGVDTRHVRIGETAQSLMPDSSFLVNFRSEAAHHVYPRVAPAEALHWAVRKETEGVLPEEARKRLAGRIVVFGVNLAGLKDLVASPLGEVMDGPEFQATVLDNLLQGDGRVRAGRGVDVLVLVLLLALLGVAGAALRTRGLSPIVALAAGVLFVPAAFVVFRAGTSIDLFTPLLGVLLTWAGTTAMRLVTEGRRNRWLEGTFGRYMAPSIIEALKQDPALLELGGRERDISVLFSDVAGFTGISTRLSAPQVVELLNRYLTQHCAPVLAEGGVVDKFEGDAVMAFFGDPVPTDDHALRACRAAVQVIEGLPGLRPVWEGMGLDAFAIRIGINSGMAVVGNMGSDQRFDYTCMGDTVNIASRLEGAAKAFGATVLIGPRTLAGARDEIVARPLGRLVVVGREEPVAVHELMGLRADASGDLLDHVEAFSQALDAAMAGAFDTARAALDEAERLRPGDGPVAWFRAVLDAHAAANEPWDGVTVLTAK